MFDLLVLSPSFSYGGIENPKMVITGFWREKAAVALGLKGVLLSSGSESEWILARMRLVSSMRLWLTTSASEEERLTPMVLE
ncbi:hypothetical protein HN51_007728 [Arachis hypogaea]